MDERECMLTTIDNPWNPFTHFNEWYAFDISHGYRSCERIARFARTSIELSDADNSAAISDAIGEFLKFDFMNIFARVYSDGTLSAV